MVPFLFDIFKAQGRTIKVAVPFPDTLDSIFGQYSRLQRYPDSNNPSDPYLDSHTATKRL